MKISVAQIRPTKGDINANIKKHKIFIEIASSLKADAIFFPELSLTGYEPTLAKQLAISQSDERLTDFQQISDAHKITIGLGAPTITKTGIRISMLIFQPGMPIQTYSKQQLHADEFPYFECGDGQLILTIGNKKIAPAICYESLQPDHSAAASKLGAEIYLASVAKPQSGLNKAITHYPEVARKYKIPVLMSNSVGFCDDFMSVGNSAVWSKEGKLVGQFDDKNEGLLVFDTNTEEMFQQYIYQTPTQAAENLLKQHHEISTIILPE